MMNYVIRFIFIVACLMKHGVTAKELSTPLGCRIPDGFGNGVVSPTERTHVIVGESVHYTCKSGYKIKGPMYRTCKMRKGEAYFTGVSPTCVECGFSCGNGKCIASRLVCDGIPHCSFAKDELNCSIETKEHQLTTHTTTPEQATTPEHPGCMHEGVYYKPGAEISSGQRGNWCYGTICGSKGEVWTWDDWNCGTTPEITTTPSTTTNYRPPGCFVDGQFYPPGKEISSGQDGNWCYGTICDSSGNVISWDNWTCGTTTPETTTPGKPPGAPGCFVDGQYYPPRKEISSGQDGNWCYGTTCDSTGNVISWDNFNCGTATPETTTTQSTTTNYGPPGCFVDGQYYPPDTQISNEQYSNWCYGTYCDSNGNTYIYILCDMF